MESAAVETMKNHVTCGICMEIYKDPRQLPCTHTICYGCYQQMFQDSQSVSCPWCTRTCSRRPDEIPKSFPTADLVETYHSFTKSTSVASRLSGGEQEDASEEFTPGQCEIPQCQRDAVAKSLFNDIKLCQMHVNKDTEKLRDKKRKLDEKEKESMVKEGGGKYLEDLKISVVKAKILQQEINESFQEIYKELRESEQLLNSVIEHHITGKLGILTAHEKEQSTTRIRLEQLEKAFQDKRYRQCINLMRQLKVLQAHRQPIKGSVDELMPVVSLLQWKTNILKELKSLRCVTTGSESNQNGNDESRYEDVVLVNQISGDETDASLQEKLGNYDDVSECRVIKDANGLPSFGYFSSSTVSKNLVAEKTHQPIHFSLRLTPVQSKVKKHENTSDIFKTELASIAFPNFSDNRQLVKALCVRPRLKQTKDSSASD